MKVTLVLSEHGRLALDERVQLLRTAVDVEDVVIAGSPWQAINRLNVRSVPYLLDVNLVTGAVAASLTARGRSYLLDTGDDPATLARATRGRPAARAYAMIEQFMLCNARGVICRGSFHQPVLRSKTTAPIRWVPDTVPDRLLDSPTGQIPRDNLVATFGSAREPAEGDRAYCWEVVDVVAATPDLEGLIIVNGPGIAALRARATRFGVRNRVSIEGPRPLPDLVTRLAAVGFVTSIQSDDLAGWVRTTGKMPIALGLGKALLTTRVGEATRILPDRFLLEPGDDEHLINGLTAIVRMGVPRDWPAQARALAEGFRRSSVAVGLRCFLASV